MVLIVLTQGASRFFLGERPQLPTVKIGWRREDSDAPSGSRGSRGGSRHGSRGGETLPSPMRHCFFFVFFPPENEDVNPLKNGGCKICKTTSLFEMATLFRGHVSFQQVYF